MRTNWILAVGSTCQNYGSDSITVELVALHVCHLLELTIIIEQCAVKTAKPRYQNYLATIP